MKKIKTVSLQSLSSGIAGEENFRPRFEIGKSRLETELNFQTVVSEHALKGAKFIQAHPEARAKDLLAALDDPKIDAIIANIGGVDSHLLWPFIDINKIKANPKPVIGYSDTTSIHFMFHLAGVQTFYGPSVLDGFAENGAMHQYTLEHFKKMVLGNGKVAVKPAKAWTSQYLEWTERKYDKVQRELTPETRGHMFFNKQTKTVEGKLLGGCLDIIAQIKNHPFFPNPEAWKNTIIFLETAENKMKPQELAKALDLMEREIAACNAIIFGKPKDETYFDEYLEIIKAKVKKPFVYNVNFGHTAPMITIPYGGLGQINFKKQTIKLAR